MANNILPGMGFHHVALKCKDLEKSLTMYGALGLTEVARWGEGEGTIVMMDMGNGAIIEFFALWVDDVELAYNTALTAGFVSVSAPNKMTLPSRPAPMNIWGAFVKGPDGEDLEFFKKL